MTQPRPPLKRIELTDETYRSPDQPPMLRPSISIRVEYRQLGTGPDSIEVQWDDGTTVPTAADICQVIAALTGVTIPVGSRP